MLVRLTPAQQAVGFAALTTWLLFGSACSIDDRLVQTGATNGSAGAGGADQDAGKADGAIRGCVASNTVSAPANGVIANLTGDADIPAFNSTASSGSFSQVAGTLNIQENQPAGPGAQYPGMILSFPGCIDASAFSGVAFDVSGSIAGCSMQYATNFIEDDAFPSDPRGLCNQPVCYSPQTSLFPTSAATTVEVPWSSLTFFATGNPVADPDDPARIDSLEWQFTVPAASDGGSDACIANADITNLRFYH
jgi:hypothetical protein